MTQKLSVSEWLIEEKRRDVIIEMLTRIKRTAPMKKLLSLLLALFMVLGMLPVTALADEVVVYQFPQSLISVEECGAVQIGTMTWTDTAGTSVEDIPVYFVALSKDKDSVQFGNMSSCLGCFVLSPQKAKFTDIDAANKVPINTVFGMGSEYYDKCIGLYSTVESAISFTTPLQKKKDCQYLSFFWQKSYRRNGFRDQKLLIIEWPDDARPKSIDKSVLEATIKNATGSIHDSDYYTESDRYNGKETSTNGFWKDMQAALAAAQTVNSNDYATQNQVDTATENLTAAIAKLIPITQVNATALYEAVQLYDTEYYCTREYWTPGSFSGFETALNTARSLLDSWYQNGEPTASNVAEKQGEVEAAAAALAEFASKLDSPANLYQQADSENALAGIRLYAEHFDPDKLVQSDYTEESWNALVSARSEALALLQTNGRWFDGLGANDLRAQTDAFAKLRAACYGLTETKESISVRVSAVDNYIIRSKNRQVDTATKTLTLVPGASIGDARSRVIPGNFDIVSDDATCVYLNGMLCYNVSASGLNGGHGYSDFLQYQPYKLRDGDELVIARIAPRSVMNVSELSEPEAANAALDLLRHQKITTSLTDGRAKAGVPFTVNVSAAKAMPAVYDGIYTPVPGASIYIGTANAEKSAAETGLVNNDTSLVTDSNGDANVTLYNEGWVLLNAFDLTNEAGTYTNGAAVMIYVEAADDLQAVKATLQAELDAAVNHERYPESHFSTDDWAAVQAAYAEGSASLTMAESSGTARDAQLAALKVIKSKQAASDAYNESNLKYFKTQLERLSKSIESLDESERDYVDSLIRAYDNMTAYQREQLTRQNISDYEAILAKNEAGLPAAVPYELHVEYDFTAIPEADRAGLQSMIAYLQANTPTEGVRDVLGGSKLAQLYTFNTTESGGGFALAGTVFTPVQTAIGRTQLSFCISPRYVTQLLIRGDRTLTINQQPYGDENFVYDLSGDTWKITDTRAKGDADSGADGNIYTVNGHSYVMQEITVEGVDASAITTLGEGFYDFSDYRGKNPSNQFFITLPDTFYRFSMPRNHVTFTVKWVPVGGSSDEIADAKETAIAALEATFSTYVQTDYSETNWLQLVAAMDHAIAEVNAAESVSAANAARQAGIAAMAAIAVTGSGGASFDSGEIIGRAHVIVENTTYPGAPFTGEIVSGWYPLGENDSMMTMVLKALKAEGFSWNGTGGAAAGDYTITYLASIAKGGESLGEFGGGAKSGWMGTLNDWFTNKGFNEFSVSNGMLANGDEIHIMYTCALGADIGGTWDTDDTSLESLTITGADLVPVFDGSVTDYMLIIEGEGANIRVTPNPANKNYQHRIFLNKYNTNSAMFKRTEMIPVKSGDTVYVGVGESGWPSMNPVSKPTKYSIAVYTISDALAALPAASDVSYADYKSHIGTVNGLEDLAGDYTGDKTKLTALKERLNYWAKVDQVKALAAAGKEDAVKAYDDLDETQQGYLTVAQINRIEEIREFLNRQTIVEATAEDGKVEAEVTGVRSQDTAHTLNAVEEGTQDITETTLTVPQKWLADLANEPVTIQTNVANITFDATAAAAIFQGEEAVTLTIKKTVVEGLDGAIDISLSNNAFTQGNAKGTATVEIPVTLQENQTIKAVYYVDENGEREELDFTYDAERSVIIVPLTHFSVYGYELQEVEPGVTPGEEDEPVTPPSSGGDEPSVTPDGRPNTGDNNRSLVTVLCSLLFASCSVTALLFVLRKKKNRKSER